MKKQAKPKRKPKRKPCQVVPLGTLTRWGRVAAISYQNGERYYWGAVSMMPASTLEASK